MLRLQSNVSEGSAWPGPDGIDVSIIVPAYNAQEFIRETIDSIRRQTLGKLEIIVVDDASADQTCTIVAAIAAFDSRVRLITRRRNGGVCVARNDGIALAHGRWIAFVDADDWIEPGRLAALVAAAEHLGADWIADDQLVVEGAEATPVQRVLGEEPKGAALTNPVHLIRRDPPERIGYGTLKPLVRQSFLNASGIGFCPGMERFEDFIFHVEVGVRGGRMALINRPLYFYRRHPGSLTARDPLATLIGMLEQNDVALALARRTSAQDVVAALMKREALIKEAIEYRSLLSDLQRGDISHAARTLRHRPRTGLSLIGGLSRAAGRRLQARL